MKIKRSASKKNQSMYNTINSIKYMFGYVWKTTNGKKFILAKFIMSLLNSIFPLAAIVFPGLIINQLTNEYRIDIIALYVGLLLITPVISNLVNSGAGYYIKKLQSDLSLKFDLYFYDHITRMDYENLEDPNVQLLQSRSQETLNSVWKIITVLCDFLTALFSLIALTSIIVTLNLFIVILIIGLVFVNSIVTKKINFKLYEIDKEASKIDRKRWGITYMMEHCDYAKELRLFGIRDLLMKMYKCNKEDTDRLNLKYLSLQNKPGMFSSIAGFVQQGIVYSFLIYNVIAKSITIGNMTIYLSAVNQFSNALHSIMNAYLEIAKSSLNVQELIDFMNIPLKQYNLGNSRPAFSKHSTIEFRNVSFKYPGSSSYALHNLNLTIHGNEKLCVVGSNGSGKSTFIKLLTRLYCPCEGEILLDGININEYNYEEYQRLYSPVFQDFVRYYFTLGENITLSSPFDKERLNDVCRKSGLIPLVNGLPKGYDTQVDKWIDQEGFEPSGGEEQRIAIARAIYHGGEVFLLDEPTAALDPIQEYEIYTRFNDMITNKTAVLITHRLSAVQLADKIAVFQNGSVVEYGTHKELYNKGGIYSEMFSKQSEFYRN